MSSSSQALQLADFMDLFSGSIHSYGMHKYNFTKEGKEQGTNATVTNKLLTIEQYKAHLTGEMGLGIIPINEAGDVKFGVIDIDVYDADLDIFIKAIEKHNFPLIPFKSKSGGLHLYIFLKQFVKAKGVIDLLKTLVTLLCLDLYVKHKLNRLIEVFPKQVVLTEGKVGTWINLPYYNVAKTRQYAIRQGRALGLDDALAYIKEKRSTLAEAQEFVKHISFNDGPPCLQTLNLLSVLDKNSGRNNYLFSFGVYLKKKDPEFWEQQLFELNNSLPVPIGADEVENTIISSLRKKDYAYKCAEQPCVDYCRKALCKQRDYGVGKEGGYFSELEYGRLVQVKAYDPYYEWEVKLPGDENFKTLRFKTEQDIIGQAAFLQLCFRELHVLPIKMKQAEWYKLINQALTELIVIAIDKDDDMSPIGLFKLLLTEFLTERAMAQTRDQIFNKRVFYFKEKDCYYFRSVDLAEFVFVMKGFRYFAPNELHGLLRDFKATPTRIKTESGKQLRVYELTKTNLENINVLTHEPFKAEFKTEEDQF